MIKRALEKLINGRSVDMSDIVKVPSVEYVMNLSTFPRKGLETPDGVIWSISGGSSDTLTSYIRGDSEPFVTIYAFEIPKGVELKYREYKITFKVRGMDILIDDVIPYRK